MHTRNPLDVLDGRTVEAPDHPGNHTGSWLCDGKTAYQWALEAVKLTQTMAPGAGQAFLVCAALTLRDKQSDPSIDPPV